MFSRQEDASSTESASTTENTAEAATAATESGTENIWQSMDSIVDGFLALVPQILAGVVVFVLACVAAAVVGRIIYRTFAGRSRENTGRVLSRLARWIVVLAGLLLATTIVAPSVSPGDLLATLGIGGVAIGFAFKDILQNFLAGVLLLIREPFRIGDEIKSGSHEGVVEEIETRATIIRSFDGDKVVIPNSKIYTNPVVVHTAHPNRRSEHSLQLDADQNLGEAVARIRRELESTEGVKNDPGPEVLVDQVQDGKVELRCRWWTGSGQQEATRVRNKVVPRISAAASRPDEEDQETAESAWRDFDRRSI